ncbi:Hermansky-Pudlak syndrome 6 protein [Xenopus tropicalis]|uniref:HPS6, biogenesis of lysosomal organelles complex 2 subunit 3 n=1 Tax=Xenopus tropicalis TaxID=8364 RepID=F7E271_XENTR|nr:Hermansky-Pudlak syndrome 6 protein [Xenopus tropicalis]
MMKFGPPQLECDFQAFGRQHVLREALHTPGSRLYHSPDGRHLFVLLPHKVLSFLRLPSQAPLSPSAYLEKSWAAHSPPLSALLFPQCVPHGWALTLLWQNGRTEIWSPPRSALSKGWELLQSLDLCNSPRARLASVCSNGESLVWCEERPPSEAKLQGPSGAKAYRHCICHRRLVWEGEQQVTLGSMNILLHHSPFFHLLSSPNHIFMVPDGNLRTNGARLLLVYSPQDERINMATITKGLIHSKSISECESDFKKLVLECLGYMASQIPVGIRSFAVTGLGELLLMDALGGVHLLHPNGMVRCIYVFDSITLTPEVRVSMQIYGATLVCAFDTVLYLIESNTGKLLEKKILSSDEVRLMNLPEVDDIHLMTKAGIYKVSSMSSVIETGKVEQVLLEMVYEEACKYYQRRSLSSAKLTVQELKKEGMFQAPIMLSSIFSNYHRAEKAKSKNYADHVNTMTNELQSCLSLEQLKAQIINIPEDVTEKYCENLIDQEIVRLLNTDLDRENLIYINFLFSLFPKAAWKSVKGTLQFHQNGDGRFIVRATVDLWKRILGPLSAGSRESSQNGVSPLFEVICESLYRFKPKWLPLFVQQAQDCSGLPWSMSNKDNCEGVPLYKRALAVVSKGKANTTANGDCDIEIDILLYSGRPQAIIQAIHMLIDLQRWERVITETQKFSQLSPIITKDIFITLLTEFVRHRHLDSYITQLCDICPEDMTPTDMLRIILQNMPDEQHLPFSCNGGTQLTVGLLRPLLNKVIQNQKAQHMKPTALTFSPSTPPETSHSFVNGDGLSPEICSVPDIYAPDSW